MLMLYMWKQAFHIYRFNFKKFDVLYLFIYYLLFVNYYTSQFIQYQSIEGVLDENQIIDQF